MSSDHYVYPGTKTLINKFGIRDFEELQKMESTMTSSRKLELFDKTNHEKIFDFDKVKSVHKHLFQDVYDWAGKPRNIEIGKNDHWFHPSSMLEHGAQYFNESMNGKTSEHINTRNEFAKTYASELNNLNQLHPFREGNGRTQREFFRQVAKHHGFDLKHEKGKELYMEGTIKDDDKLVENYFKASIENEKTKKKTKDKDNTLEQER